MRNTIKTTLFTFTLVLFAGCFVRSVIGAPKIIKYNDLQTATGSAILGGGYSTAINSFLSSCLDPSIYNNTSEATLDAEYSFNYEREFDLYIRRKTLVVSS